jgi:hypothetical protein
LECRTAIRFDLDSLAGTTVDSATLRLYTKTVANTLVEPFRCVAFAGAWSGSTLTFNNQPPTYASPAAQQTPPAALGWWDLDITEIVRQWASGTIPNYGMLLYSNVPEYYMHTSQFTPPPAAFYDSSSAELAPRLLVTYH